MEMINIGLIFVSNKLLGILWKNKELGATLLITQPSNFFPYLLLSLNKKFVKKEFFTLN